MIFNGMASWLKPAFIVMVHECCTAELLPMAAFMHDDDKGHTLLKHYAALKGLMVVYSIPIY